MAGDLSAITSQRMPRWSVKFCGFCYSKSRISCQFFPRGARNGPFAMAPGGGRPHPSAWHEPLCKNAQSRASCTRFSGGSIIFLDGLQLRIKCTVTNRIIADAESARANKQTSKQAIKQSSNQTIKQSNNQASWLARRMVRQNWQACNRLFLDRIPAGR